MSKTITCSLDISKIQKEHFYEDRTGRKWLDIYVVETPNSQFGTPYMITQGVSKESRNRGIRGNVLGNGRVIDSMPGTPKPQPKQDDNCPF